MFLIGKFAVICPEGYRPIVRPKEWNETSDSYGSESKMLRFPINLPCSCFINKQSYLKELTNQLINIYDVKVAATLQLTKLSVNDFIVGIEGESAHKSKILFESVAKSNHSVDSYPLSVRAYDLWIFQRDPKFVPKTL